MLTTKLRALDIAVSEEKSRREGSFYSVEKLHDVFVREYHKSENITDYRESAVKLINDDIILQEKMDAYFKENFSVGNFPLRTNKNALLFKHALEFLEKGTDLLSENIFKDLNLEKDEVNKIESDNANGSSLLNILQIALIASIRAVTGISNIEELNAKLSDGSYNLETSPVIQAVPIPDQEYTESSYFYYDKGNNELATPMLGYAFGGSRGHARYETKELKAEDCSSAVAKWTCAPGTFATYSMKWAYAGDCKGDNLCANVQATLLPKAAIDSYVEGDIFVKRFHTGIISSILNETCFESLSYNRDVPAIEGLVYQDVCCAESECLFFEELGNCNLIHDEL